MASKMTPKQLIILIVLAASLFLIGFFGVRQSGRGRISVKPGWGSKKTQQQKPDIWLEDFFGGGNKGGKGDPKRIGR